MFSVRVRLKFLHRVETLFEPAKDHLRDFRLVRHWGTKIVNRLVRRGGESERLEGGEALADDDNEHHAVAILTSHQAPRIDNAQTLRVASFRKYILFLGDRDTGQNYPAAAPIASGLAGSASYFR